MCLCMCEMYVLNSTVLLTSFITQDIRISHTPIKLSLRRVVFVDSVFGHFDNICVTSILGPSFTSTNLIHTSVLLLNPLYNR